MQYDDDDDELNPDAHSQTSQPIPQDLGKLPKEALLQLIAKERAVHADISKDLQVERAAHDETAEKMVQLQQRLEVTLQELANLERFTKRQQPNASPGTPSHVEKLLKEEAYLKSRLSFVQAELSDARHHAGGAEAADAEDGLSI